MAGEEDGGRFDRHDYDAAMNEAPAETPQSTEEPYVDDLLASDYSCRRWQHTDHRLHRLCLEPACKLPHSAPTAVQRMATFTLATLTSK